MLKKSKVLVVDDSPSIREIIGSELLDEGFSIEKAVDGLDGLEMLEKHSDFQLIITDLNMPRMDGISFLKAVREMDQFKYLPILILTTECQVDKKIEARNAGATGWIIKPFVSEKLISVVKKVIK